MSIASKRIGRSSLTLSKIRLALALATLAMATFPGFAGQGQMYSGGLAARSLLTQPIDEKKLTVLRGNTPPAANVKNDRGLVPDSMQLPQLLLVLQRPPELEAQLEKLIDEMQRPGSPDYHKWLSARELGQRFGPSQDDVNKIVSWFESNGFGVDGVSASGLTIVFSGNAGLVRQVFHTEIHYLSVEGESHFANMTDPQVPTALSGVVAGVAGLNNFMPQSDHLPASDFTFNNSGSLYYIVAPGDLATIYNLNSAFTHGDTGSGQTIAVVEDSDLLNASDVSTFRSEFGLSGYSGTFTQVHPTGTLTCADPGENADEVEAAIDAEWAGAAAPNAAIQLASCANTTDAGVHIAIENLLGQTTPPNIISVSYSACEANNGAGANQVWVNTFQQAATEGVSVFTSSGDSGAANCDNHATFATHGIAVTGIGSTPYNVAVGGTDFGDYYNHLEGGSPLSTYWSPTNSSALESAVSYIPEIPWNSSCTSSIIDTEEGYSAGYGTSGFCNVSAGASYVNTKAGGGGPSTYSNQPSWQGAFGLPTAPPAGGDSSTNPRYLPDVALFAATGTQTHFYVYCMTDTTEKGGTCSTTDFTELKVNSGGGTSFAAPIMAGIQALVNQAQGGRSQGNPNPVYYALATTEYGAAGSSVCNSSLGTGTASACIFYDVTTGDNVIPCEGTIDCYDPSGTYGALSLSDASFEGVYPTGTGWDYATGLGSVNAWNLIQNWNGVLTSTGVTTPDNTVGANTSVTFTATVSSTIGHGLTGTVTWSSNTGCTASALSGGQTTCTTYALPTGSDAVTATYSGTTFADASPYFASSTGNTTETVNAATSPTLTWNPIPTIIAGTTFAGEMTAQSNATGSFVYTAALGAGSPEDVTDTSILASGSYTLAAAFTPTGGNGYAPGSIGGKPLTVSGESVWIADGGGGTAELAGNGYGITSTADPGANKAVAIDNAGNVWSAGSGAPLLEATSQVGTVLYSFSSGGGLNAPAGIVIDGAGQAWVTNGNNSVSLFANEGAAVSPTTGFTDSSLSTPTGIAVDLGGSVWIANKGSNSVTRILGAAVPAAPLSTAAANKTTGTKP
jgi:subtilase family serine protease